MLKNIVFTLFPYILCLAIGLIFNGKAAILFWGLFSCFMFVLTAFTRFVNIAINRTDIENGLFWVMFFIYNGAIALTLYFYI